MKNTPIASQQVREENEMSTIKEFLIWHNNLDMVPFLEAVGKMIVFWQERKINMFKDGISVPGLTLKVPLLVPLAANLLQPLR